MTPTQLFWLEVLLPIALPAAGLIAFHRSQARWALQARGVLWCLLFGLLVGVLAALGWLMSAWGLSFAYRKIAAAFGHQALGAAWDVRLALSLTLSLVLQGLLLSGYVVRLAWSARASRRAAVDCSPADA